MLEFLKKVFTPSEPIDFKELISNGAQIIDVRTTGEYRGGHIKRSKNIPLQELSGKIDSLNKHKTYILCCASGGRSGSARRMMSSAGFENVHNGGGWMQLQNKIS
ncbi:MAG: rhodanese-like domain-containing protein [Balneolaceae bacterium]